MAITDEDDEAHQEQLPKKQETEELAIEEIIQRDEEKIETAQPIARKQVSNFEPYNIMRFLISISDIR